MTEQADHAANALAWLRPTVRDIPDYKGPKTASDVDLDKVRILHLNESPHPPSPKAIEAIQNFSENLNRYPDIYVRALSDALSDRTGIPPEQIVFGAGTDELVHFICEITTGPGDVAVMPWPTFPRYALTTRIEGGESIKVPLNDAGANDADALLAAINNRTRTVWCCTPNPPSGGMMDESALRQLADGVPENVLLAVDEAYHEYGMHAGGPDVLDAIKHRRGPWLVLRTFSKAYGLGAVRVGYALCGSVEVANALSKTKLQYNTNSLGQAAALAALEDDDYLQKTLDLMATERSRLAEGLSSLGLKPLPTAANFVSAALPCNAAEVMKALAERNILTRDWRDPGHPRHIRITVGLPDDTDAVLAAMTEILDEME
tara:strand:+ start:7216 stop:8340 length:1125 start_codon:yes stop_codon:yes gene_type:complete